MPQKKYTTHTNEEPIRRCPYCPEHDAWEGPGRGLTFHVLNTSDDVHAEKYELPDDFDASNAPIVGHGDVSVTMPSRYNVGRRKRYVCDYCGRVCQGQAGLKVHLSHMGGDEVHPEDANTRDPDTFPSFAVDENGDLVTQDEESLSVASGGVLPSMAERDTIPVEELEQLRDAFLHDEQTLHDISPTEAAERVQDLLNSYGAESATA